MTRSRAGRRGPLRREDTVAVASRTTVLSLAVRLLDATTGAPPTDLPDVAIEGTDAEPIERRGGYLLYLDLDLTLDDPDDPVTVSVDGGERYEDDERDVVVLQVTDHAPVPGVEVLVWLRPVVTFDLEPATT